MAQIKIISSMAFDVICYLQRRFLNNKNWLLAEEIEFIEKINALCAGRLGDDCLGMSTLCLILTVYAENADFEKYSLDDLAELFKNPEDIRNVVKAKITNEFQASYTYPMLDWLVDGWAKKYVKMIGILKEIGFDKLWESDLLPIIQKEIKAKEEKYKDADINAILMDIQKLKQCEPLGDVKIYVSSISYPTAFTLHGNSFLECVYNNSNVGMICHELMHGFATKELTDLYLEYIKSIKYLAEQHDRLIKEQHSGNEEEFVMAAEYLLRMRNNNETKKDLLKEARSRYNGCVPTSVFLFDLLSKDPEIPNGYAQWLTDIFKNKKLPKKAIELHLDEIAPKDPLENFYDSLFSSFKRMINKIESIQAGGAFEAEKIITNIINKNFDETEEKSVYYRQEWQPLPNAVKVKKAQHENLFLNIAEYKNRESALMDKLNNRGANITPKMEQINGEWYSLYYVNLCHMENLTATVGTSFVKENFKISFTINCPDVIRTDGDSSAFMIKYADEILLNQKIVEDIIMQL